MSGKFGLFVVALAAAALVLCESESFAGRRHGGRGCSSCGSACATCTAAAPADATAQSPDTKASELAVKADDASPSSSAVAATPSTSGTKYVSRRSARRSRR